ncbi:MAG: hypothetical protein AB2662_17370 [Candidatus Thiodiazotropha sp.]
MYLETNSDKKEQFLAACEVVQHDRDSVLNLLMEQFVSNVVDFVDGYSENKLAWNEARKHLEFE